MRARISMAVIAAVLFATVVMAQRMRPMNNGSGTPPDPATMIARRVSRLQTLLNLTDAQAAQATTIFTNAATAESPLRTSLMTAHSALQDAIKANNTAVIDQQAATIGSLSGQITGIQAKADAAFYALLTTDQQTKYNELGARGFGPAGMGPGRFGMRPGGPPPGR
jgi:Spy/CpxP family protein refolding chaperone